MCSMESSMNIVLDALSETEFEEMEALVNYLPDLLEDGALVGVTPAKLLGAGSGLLVASENHIWFILKGWGSSAIKNWDADFNKITAAHWSAGKLKLNKQGAFSFNAEFELVGTKPSESFLNALADLTPLTRDSASPAKLSNRVEWRDTVSVPQEKTDAIDRALKSVSVLDAKALSKGEIKELPNVLWEDELPVAVITGMYHDGNGILVATDRRLIFIDKGLIGLTVEDIYFEDISSIESHQGIMSGSLTIYARGNKESIGFVQNDSVRPFSDFLRNEIAKSKQMKVDMLAQTQQAAHTPTRADDIDALFKLAELHKMGVLTDDEFAEQKAKLLM